jgi:hypothetical protein
MTANLALPLACEHVYFNYEFLTGMFLCSNYNDIMDNLNKIKEASSYSLSLESKKAHEEIALLTLIMLPFIASNEMQFIIGLEIVSIRFSIRPPIAIRSGSKSKKFGSRSKIFVRNPTFSDFDRQSDRNLPF